MSMTYTLPFAPGQELSWPATLAVRARRRTGWYALAAAAYTYLLMIFGGVVRITGSGLGCGDAWPSCNGDWWPGWNLTVWIEWTHRLLGAGALIPFVIMLWPIFRHRRSTAFRGLLAPAGWSVGLLFLQAALGAITVKLETSPPVTTLHFLNGTLLLGVLVVLASRALRGPAKRACKARLPMTAAILALLAITWGALTANLGAGLACRGFPLCNGDLLPMGTSPALTGLMHLHWVHRLLGYALAIVVLAGVVRSRAPGTSQSHRVAALLAMLAILLQIGLGAGLVLQGLPPLWRGLHVAMGVAVFAVLLNWTLIARRTLPHNQVSEPPSRSRSAMVVT